VTVPTRDAGTQDPVPETSGDGPLLLVTGAAGVVGSIAVAGLRDHYRLRLVDREWSRQPDSRLAGDQVERVTADLNSADVCADMLADVSMVLHLAGNPSPDIDASTAVAETATVSATLADAVARSTVQRLIYASSIHTLGLYLRDLYVRDLSEGGLTSPIAVDWPPRPCCEYGAAKLLGEQVLGLLALRAICPVVSLRLGLVGHTPTSVEDARRWLGERDFQSLIRAALAANHSGTYLAVSTAAADQWDLTATTKAFGYQPQDLPPRPPAPRHEDCSTTRCLMGR
jgi:NAD dependent epimerase/dehydratase family